jgi:adenylate cyclase
MASPRIVLTELSKLRWLFVIARNSSFTYKGKAVDIKQVGRDLGIRYVLEGSVRRAGSRVRITAQLIDATTGAHIWAERYDRDLVDIFAVQDEITAAVASAIGTAIVDAERQRAVRKLPETLGAWEAYQRGMWHLSKHDAAENELARACFQRAVDLDPSYAPGYSALAWSYVVSGVAFSSMTNTEWVNLAEPLARKAVALDENDADARARLALALF